jgi:hypothetical protein
MSFEYLVFARTFLEKQFGLAAPAGVLVVLVFLSQYLVRRFAPNVWERMADLPFPGGAHKPAVALARKAWQALPSAVTGAFLGALAYKEDATAAVIGAVVALIAPVGHELIKASPLPYRGGKPPAADPAEPSATEGEKP